MTLAEAQVWPAGSVSVSSISGRCRRPTRQEWRKLQVDVHPLSIGVGFGAQVEDAGLFGREVRNLWVEEEGVH